MQPNAPLDYRGVNHRQRRPLSLEAKTIIAIALFMMLVIGAVLWVFLPLLLGQL